MRLIKTWVIILIALSLLIGSLVVILRATGARNVCLNATDDQYTTRTLDTNTGKLFTSTRFPLKSYEHLAVSFPSPDKTKIAFSWVSNNYVRLLTMLDLRSLQKQTMTFSLTDNELLVDSWSADGGYVTLYERKDNGQSSFNVYEAATMRLVVSKAVLDAVWSPRGHTIAYLETENANLSGITIADPVLRREQTFSLSNNLERLDLPVKSPGLVWSPDGRYLALVNSTNIWLYNVEAMTLKVVTNYADLGSDIHQWSADGKALLYTQSNGNGKSSLVEYHPATDGSTVLDSDLSGVLSYQPDAKYVIAIHKQPDQSIGYYLLDIETGREFLLKGNNAPLQPIRIFWSNQNQVLAFMYDDGVFWGNADGSVRHDVTGLSHMTPLYWDDHWIAYSSFQVDGDHPGLINLQTGDHRTFKEAYNDLFDLFPSPDGQTLALLFAQQPGLHSVKMVLFSADDQHATTYETRSGDMGRLVWSPDSGQFALYTYTLSGPTTLHLLRPDGTEVRHYDNLPPKLYLDRWTNCG